MKAETEPSYYVPTTQAPLADMLVLVRTQGDPVAVVPALRNTVWAIDPNQPIADIKTMNQILSDSIEQPRLNMLLMGVFGALALILAAIGGAGIVYAIRRRAGQAN